MAVLDVHKGVSAFVSPSGSGHEVFDELFEFVV